MVKFNEIDPKEFPNTRMGRRGRVSYPILKSFLETGYGVAELDRSGMQQSFQSLYSSLRAYAINHDMPIKLVSRSGEIYLIRTDLDEDGNPIEDWREKNEQDQGTHKFVDTLESEATPVNVGEAKTRYIEEKDQTAK